MSTVINFSITYNIQIKLIWPKTDIKENIPVFLYHIYFSDYFIE